MRMNKTACKIGMIAGLVIIIVGIVFASKSSFYSSSASYWYDSGYALFGADFYNYVNNNTAEATANIKQVGYAVESVNNSLGILMVCFGFFDVCLFWALHGGKNENTAVSEDVVKKLSTIIDEMQKLSREQKYEPITVVQAVTESKRATVQPIASVTETVSHEGHAEAEGKIPLLGISAEDLPKRTGVRVTAVEETGIGAKAGVSVNDLIVSINDAEISCVKDLEQRSTRWKVGSTVYLKLRRDGTFVNTSIRF